MQPPDSNHYVISSSYGNDSVALIQWAKDFGLDMYGRVTVAYCDTGWAAKGWGDRVLLGEDFARRCGFETVRLTSIGMEELVRTKKGFPGTGPTQFCTMHLKGVPYLQWLDEIDPERRAITLIGKRREESEKRKDTPEFIESSVYHGDRMLWHPLYLHGELLRNELLRRAEFDVLPHRSEECNPCVYANRGDLKRLTTHDIEKVCSMEVEIGKPMFRPKRFGAVGIHGVMIWAKYGRTGARSDIDELYEDEGCGSAMGCGL